MYLNCHTYYSLRYGIFSVEELCVLAQSKAISGLALTDINNTSGCLPFLKIAPNYGIKPLIGIDFRNGSVQQYVGIAKSNRGFQQLNAFLSEHLHEKIPFENEAPSLSDCYFIYPFDNLRKTNFSENEFIGVSVDELRKLKFSELRDHQEKLVVLQTVSFRNKKDFNAHRLLRSIDNNSLLSKLPETEQAKPNDRMFSYDELKTGFTDFPHILENTESLIENCQVGFGFEKERCNQNLETFEKDKAADIENLKALCFENLPKRYPKPSKKTLARIQKELKSIIDLGFVPYFLINYDLVQYARSKNYPFIGRGSGANSVVAYIIGITNVDPIELDLYFERFINPERNSPPDFDLDFSWKDRNDVTAYIFRKYPNTALIATYVTFKRRAVIRELGKVFGLPKAEIDKLSGGYFRSDDLDELEKLVLRYSKLIEGFPNYLSVHSGGIMITERPVHYFAGTFLPPKGFPTIQIDMHTAEMVGIFKFDILAQRGLSKIGDTIKLIKQNQPEAKIEDIDDIDKFKKDPKINKLLQTGDCMGVFYVESPAMKALLTKLETNDYLGLVAASSIIRPGVSQGGMKEQYILRHRFPEKRKDAHPVLYQIMPDTYGIMVYQEDVLKVAHFFGGLSLGEADVLRRGMSGKKLAAGEFQRIEEKFRKNCCEKGHRPQLIEEVWHQIKSFAGYAFPKGHSASYAVESYQSLYLKRYFPLEFMVAVVNNGGGFYNTETYLHELKKCGATLHPPCINHSDHPMTIKGKNVYLGLGHLKELETKTIQNILENRQSFGSFQSLDDFIDRVFISIDQLIILLKINAFRFTGLNKHQLLWKAYFKLSKTTKRSSQKTLFNPPHVDLNLPEFEYSFLVDVFDQFELLGFSLYGYLALLKNAMESSVKVCDLKNNIGKRIQIYGDLVVVRKTRTTNNKYMYFGNFFDLDGELFNTVHFPSVAEKYPIYGKGVFLCRGKVVNELGHFSIQIDTIIRQKMMGDPRLIGTLGEGKY